MLQSTLEVGYDMSLNKAFSATALAYISVYVVHNAAHIRQTQAITAVRGRVSDANDAPVPDGTVTVRNDSTGSHAPRSSYDAITLGPTCRSALHRNRSEAGFETQRHTGVTLDAGPRRWMILNSKSALVSNRIEVTGALLSSAVAFDVVRTIVYAEITKPAADVA